MAGKTILIAVLSYLVAFAILFVVAYFPSKSMGDSTDSAWYACIRPSVTPPNIVFPIVWTTLYVLIAIALAETLRHIWRSHTGVLWLLLAAYALNLALNASWTYVYFGQRNVMLAFIILLMLWGTTLFLVVATFNELPYKWVGFILLPYLLWITFASVLNGMSVSKAESCANA